MADTFLTLHNNDTIDHFWGGQEVLIDGYVTVQEPDRERLLNDEDFLIDLVSGKAEIFAETLKLEPFVALSYLKRVYIKVQSKGTDPNGNSNGLEVDLVHTIDFDRNLNTNNDGYGRYKIGSSTQVFSDGTFFGDAYAFNFGDNVELNDDGYGFISVTPTGIDGYAEQCSPDKFEAYNTTSEPVITGSWTDVLYDIQRENDSTFTHTLGAAEIEFEEAGSYLILAKVTVDISSGNSRSASDARIVLDTGAGYNAVDGTYGLMYNREINEGGTTTTVPLILTVDAGDKIKVQARRKSGGGALKLLSEYNSISITSLKGCKGDKGDTGDPAGAGDGYIIVQEDGTTVGDAINKLNFTGNVDVTVDGYCAEINITGGGDDDDDCDKYVLQFDKKSNSVLTSTLLDSTLGYKLTGDGYLTGYSIITDESNSDIYKIKKNGTELASTTFTDEDCKIVSGQELEVSTNDILQVEYCKVLEEIDIHSAYPPDGYTLFLGHMDGDDADDRHITNDTTSSEMCGNIGRLRNGVICGVDGPFGSSPSAYDFNGYDNWVQILHNKAYDVQDSTVEMWVKADTTSGTDYIFSKDATGYQTGGHLTIWRYGDDLKVRSQSSSNNCTYTIANVFDTSNWHHIAVVLGTGGIKIFFDGTLEETDVAWEQGLDGNREPIVLGAKSDASSTSITDELSCYWNGKIAQVRISDTRRYESGFSVPTSEFINDGDTTGLWALDESSGNLALDKSDTIGSFMIQSTGSFPDIVSSPVKIGTDSIKMNYSPNECLRQIHNPKYEVSCFTVEGWIYQYTDSYDGIIFQKGTSETEGGLTIKWIDIGDKLQVTYYGASTSRQITSSTDSFNSYEWHHFAVSASTTELKLFIDGALVATESLTGDFSNVWNNNIADLFWACGSVAGSAGRGNSDSDSSSGTGSGSGSDSDSDGCTSSRLSFMQGYFDELRISGSCRDFENGEGSLVKQISVLLNMECCE